MPDGTTPQNAAAHAAAGPASKGLRIGGITIPWWAVGVGAVGVGLVGFLIYRQMQSSGAATGASGSSTASPMAPGVSNAGTPTAATLVPLPYPTSSSTTGQTATAASGLGTMTIGNPYTSGQYAGKVPLYSTPGNAEPSAFGALLPTGTTVTQEGPPQIYNGLQEYPVSYQGGSYFLAQPNVSASSLNSTQLAGQAA